MNRRLLRNLSAQARAEQEARDEAEGEDGPRREGPFSPADAQKLDQTMKSRSLWWVIGTSLAFEAVVLLLAAWSFCRRDF
jgi:hypothetical protein